MQKDNVDAIDLSADSNKTLRPIYYNISYEFADKSVTCN